MVGLCALVLGAKKATRSRTKKMPQKKLWAETFDDVDSGDDEQMASVLQASYDNYVNAPWNIKPPPGPDAAQSRPAPALLGPFFAKRRSR